MTSCTTALRAEKESEFAMKRTIQIFALTALTALVGCAAEAGYETGEVNDEVIAGASESGSAITTRYPAGTTARTTANLNLRSGASTDDDVIVVMPAGSRVTLVDGSPDSGWYAVQFNGEEGYAFGSRLRVDAAAPMPPPEMMPDPAMPDPAMPGGGVSMSGDFAGQQSRAQSGEGFSYYWGHGAWDPSGATAANRGTCSGSCPGCSHRGDYGADCSGFVGKVWQISECAGDLTEDKHGPGTSTYRHSDGGGQWSQVDRSNLQPGDVLVYNSGSGHIVWVNGGDGWGSPDVYESRGCRYGVVRNNRSFGSEYIAIRRN